jgi:hypothetical protein
MDVFVTGGGFLKCEDDAEAVPASEMVFVERTGVWKTGVLLDAGALLLLLLLVARAGVWKAGRFTTGTLFALLLVAIFLVLLLSAIAVGVDRRGIIGGILRVSFGFGFCRD